MSIISQSKTCYWTSMPIISQYNSYFWSSISIISQSNSYYWTPRSSGCLNLYFFGFELIFVGVRTYTFGCLNLYCGSTAAAASQQLSPLGRALGPSRPGTRYSVRAESLTSMTPGQSVFVCCFRNCYFWTHGNCWHGWQFWIFCIFQFCNLRLVSPFCVSSSCAFFLSYFYTWRMFWMRH